jgi:RNA polymerase sigma-70 factor (ECF subfamily)
MLGICLSLIDDEDSKHRFEQLYYKYRQRMYAVAYAILNNPHDAEDAVQTAFLSAANNFKKISSFSCQEIEAYFVIIIRNHSINTYRKNKKVNCQSKRNTFKVNAMVLRLL